MRNKTQTLPFAEFITLMALFVSLMAMSIDAILPALGVMQQDLNIASENSTQYIIGAIFLGFTLGQITCGPLSDSFGRRLIIYLGLLVFIFATLICISANNFETMLWGRFLQGFGAAAPRIVSIAVVRDLYKGREMARVMSFIMSIFIIVPVVAPAIGQAILLVGTWHIIFALFLISSIIAMMWTYIRLPETLKPQDRKAFKFSAIKHDFYKVVTNKITLGYAICAGLIFGALIGYLNSSRQIFQDYFLVGNLMPFYFAITAISIGVASIVNSQIVRRFGMKVICHYSLMAMIVISALFCALLIFSNQPTPLWQFMIYAPILFFFLGLLFGNLNAMAMEPMGHYAGMASAIVGSISSAISLIMGTLIGQAYNGTLMPLVTGFLVLAVAAYFLQEWLGKKTK